VGIPPDEVFGEREEGRVPGIGQELLDVSLGHPDRLPHDPRRPGLALRHHPDAPARHGRVQGYRLDDADVSAGARRRIRRRAGGVPSRRPDPAQGRRPGGADLQPARGHGSSSSPLAARVSHTAQDAELSSVAARTSGSLVDSVAMADLSSAAAAVGVGVGWRVGSPDFLFPFCFASAGSSSQAQRGGAEN